ncbi:MAG TPA: tripartite tricarboxylate transporter substrate-binding protein [Xanthobacteraceae bacterium]|nr:tripartite tricarboxylate transporter substrate-binding protein [Xanthobacteraceae bacterium]
MKRTALVLLACLSGTAAPAQSFPSKSVTIYVTAAAGGVTDVVARAVGQRLAELWNQSVVIENRGGGAHILGAQAVAKAAPDGHTLLLAEAGTFVLNPSLYPRDKLGYDVEEDLAPITGVVRINQALIASNDLPVSNMRELIALASQKPGEITYGTAGVGSAPHVNIAKLEYMAHVAMQAIHYRGAAPALNDVMAGHIKLMSVSTSLVVQPFQDRKLKILAVGSPNRAAQLPDVPTVSESVPGYEAATWFGLATTGGTPRDVIMKINADVQKVMSDPGFRSQFMAPQMFESMASAPERFEQFIRSETQNWAKIIREQKLAIQ